MWETLFVSLCGSQVLAHEVSHTGRHGVSHAGRQSGNQSAAMKDPAHEP